MDVLVDIYRDNFTGQHFLVDKRTDKVYALQPEIPEGLGADWGAIADMTAAVLPTITNLVNGGSGGQQYQPVATNIQWPSAYAQGQIDALSSQKQSSSSSAIIWIGGGALLLIMTIGIILIRKK